MKAPRPHGRRTRSAARSPTQSPLMTLRQWVERPESAWWTVSVNFRARTKWIMIAGVRWRVIYSCYGTRWGWTDRSGIRYMLNVSMSAPRITARQRRDLIVRGWYRETAACLKKLGYDGKWHRHKDGPFGLFSKRAIDFQALQVEAKRLLDVGIERG